MATAEDAFVAKIRDQIDNYLRGEYAYNELHVYVSGIAEPWVFGPDDEFEFVAELLIVRVGPSKEVENEGVPEYVFPIRHVVATELAVSGQ
jgi:hypothetical protein